MWSRFATEENAALLGERAYRLVEELYPLCRSITGEGLRSTLAMVAKSIPLKIHEVPSGTEVFDWVVPPEWRIRDAFIEGADGRRYAEFSSHNLHVASYSSPVDQRMERAELVTHIHSLPEHPEWIPYRTTYYSEGWGFCLPHKTVLALPEGSYRAVIDSELKPGSLSYGECFLPGKSEETFLIWTHCCHPSMCNDNLSGVAVAHGLAEVLSRQEALNRSYLVVFAPATIGAVTWISRNVKRLPSIRGGLVLAVAGDRGKLNYKKTPGGDAEVDRLAEHVLSSSGLEHGLLDFDPYGYDERQFSSPGVKVPMGRLTRTPNGCFPEYHTSADDLSFVCAEALGETLQVALAIMEGFDNDRVLKNTHPFCEPQLGKRGLYPKGGGAQSVERRVRTLLWLLNQADGSRSLLDIARRTGIPFSELTEGAALLCEGDLLELVS